MPGFISAVNTSIHVPIGCTHIYDISFLTGFSIAASVFVLLHHLFPARAIDAFVQNNASTSRQVMAEFQDKWDSMATAAVAAASEEDEDSRTTMGTAAIEQKILPKHADTLTEIAP